MFDLQSDEYEKCLLSGFHVHQCMRLLSGSMALGNPPESQSTKHGTDEDNGDESATHGPFSTSHSFNLKKCCEIENAFREAANKLPATLPSSTLMSELQRNQRSAAVRQSIQQLATNEHMSPHTKRLEVCDGLRHLLSLTGEDILWESVVEYVALLLALDRLIAGDDSVEVLLGEMDLAVLYCRLQRFEAALQHAARTIVLLGRVGNTPFPHSFIERRIAMVRCIAYFEHSPDVATEQGRLLLELSQSPHSAKPSFSTQILRYATTAAKYGVLSQTFNDALNSASTGSECILLFLCALGPSLGMLRRADAELRSPAVRHAREKLLLLASSAATKRELESVNAELCRVVENLREKNSALQIALVRSAEEIATTAECCAANLRKFPFAKELYFSICIFSLVHQRALALLHRPTRSIASAASLIASLETTCGPTWGVVACADVLAAVVGGDVVQHHTLTSVLHKLVVPLFDRSYLPPSQEADAATFVLLLEGLRRQAAEHSKSNRNGEDSDEDDGDKPATQEWQDVAEASFVKMYQDETDFGDDVRIRFAHLLEQLYHRCASSMAETRVMALQAAMASRIHGPVAQKTKLAVSKYIASLRRVAAPSASPSWGVVPHLSTVTLTATAPHSQIFVSIARASDRTEQHCVRYDGPVVLDRLGKVILRAYAEKDGQRSSTIETRYFVQARSF